MKFQECPPERATPHLLYIALCVFVSLHLLCTSVCLCMCACVCTHGPVYACLGSPPFWKTLSWSKSVINSLSLRFDKGSFLSTKSIVYNSQHRARWSRVGEDSNRGSKSSQLCYKLEEWVSDTYVLRSSCTWVSKTKEGKKCRMSGKKECRTPIAVFTPAKKKHPGVVTIRPCLILFLN